jgi:hypothetical protein
MTIGADDSQPQAVREELTSTTATAPGPWGEAMGHHLWVVGVFAASVAGILLVRD